MPKNLTSIHGRKVGIDHDGYVIAKGFVHGIDGKSVHKFSPHKVVLEEDFVGISTQAINPKLVFTEGTDSTTSSGTITVGVEGVYTLLAGDSAGTIAADGAQLNSELNWKANQGGLVLEARVKLAAITTVCAFIGFTDTLALEGPVSLSGTTFTTNASDAVGFLFDTAATTDTIRLVGVAADTDATMQDTSLAFVNDTYRTLRIELSSTGVAHFYIDGVSVGTKMTGAVTPTVALTPVFVVRPEGAVAGRTISIDYFHVSANRS